jgi:sulfopyruvate decarboxylase TPP-binding subunit
VAHLRCDRSRRAITWSDTFIDVFKKNDVRFISYVPDNVVTPLIKGVTSDSYFISVNATRAASTTAGWCCWR